MKEEKELSPKVQEKAKEEKKARVLASNKMKGENKGKPATPSFQLVKMFVITRLIITFVAVPLLHLVWNKKSRPDIELEHSLYDKIVIRPLR